MTTSVREKDNRDLDGYLIYCEARIEALRNALYQAERDRDTLKNELEWKTAVMTQLYDDLNAVKLENVRLLRDREVETT